MLPVSAPATAERAFITARALARQLGLKVGTLSKWRRTGRGPAGWVYTSQTCVLYPVAAIDDFLRGREGLRPAPVPLGARGEAANIGRSVIP
jgi:hypothetical protein